MPQSKLEWALHLRDLGLQVFSLVHTLPDDSCSCGDPACKPKNRGKHPKPGSHGFKDATSDTAKIKAMWAEDPDANIGVWAGPEHVWIDLDTKGEKSGLSTLADFLKVDSFDLTDQTFSVRTPSGGIHMYYRTPVPVGDRVGILPNVDIRGAGGYVVGPGSNIGDRKYEVITDRAIMDVPEGIQTVLRHVKERDEFAQTEIFELDLPDSISRARDFLKRRPPAVEGEGGNEHTYVTALLVRDLGISEEKCVELMMEEWNDRCDPPWDRDEIEVPIGNAFRYAKDRPGNKGQTLDGFDDSAYDVKDSEDAGENVDKFAKFRSNVFRINEFLDLDRNYEFIIPGWLPSQGYTIVNGKRGCGKTTVIIDMVSCISLDMDWHDIKIDKGWTVCYIAAEDPEGVKQRFEAWRKKYFKDEQWPDENRLIICAQPIDVCDAEQVRDFTEFVLDQVGKKRRVVFVVDTWQRSLLSAKGGQNDDASMTIAVHNMESMCRSLRGPTIIAAHPPKGNEDTVLGSSVIENASQSIIQIRNNSGIREAEVIRIKGCPDGGRLKFKLQTVDIKGVDNLGNQRNGAVLEILGGTGKDNSPKLKEIDLQMARLIADIVKGYKDFDPLINEVPSIAMVTKVLHRIAVQAATNQKAKQWVEMWGEMGLERLPEKPLAGRANDNKIFKRIAGLVPENEMGIPTNHKDEWLKRTTKEIIVFKKKSLMDDEDEIEVDDGEIKVEDI